MEKTLNLVKNDPWLEPFAGAITGRHQHVLDKEAELTIRENKPFQILHQGIFILDCIAPIRGGRSANGHRMLLIFIWWVHLIIGRKKPPTAEKAREWQLGNQPPGGCHSSWRPL